MRTHYSMMLSIASAAGFSRELVGSFFDWYEEALAGQD